MNKYTVYRDQKRGRKTFAIVWAINADLAAEHLKNADKRAIVICQDLGLLPEGATEWISHIVYRAELRRSAQEGEGSAKET